MRASRAKGACGQLLWMTPILLLLAACAEDGALTARPHDPAVGDRAANRINQPSFEAASIRINPLTRRVDPSGGVPMAAASGPPGQATELEIRVECLDADGLEVRTSGWLWAEIESAGQRWTVGPVDLQNRRTNLSHFEGITRSYRLSVTLPAEARPAPGSEVEINAFLRLPDGTLLTDRRSLAWR